MRRAQVVLLKESALVGGIKFGLGCMVLFLAALGVLALVGILVV